MSGVDTIKRSLNATKRSPNGQTSGITTRAKSRLSDKCIEGQSEDKLKPKTSRRRKGERNESHVSVNKLSPKRFRKSKYSSDSHEVIPKNHMVSDSVQTHDSQHIIGCDSCDQTIDKTLKLCQHMTSDHKSDELVAKILPFPELVESDTTLDGRIKCGKCCFGTDSEALMILHSVNHVITINEMNSAAKSRLKCPTCGQLFTKSLLRKHVYIHTSEKPYKCDECFQEFTTSSLLSNHQMKHNLTTDSLIKCEICCATFRTKKSYQKHQTIHKTDRKRSHLCDVCGIGFYDKESLKSHIIRLHLPKNARRFQCDFIDCRYTCLYRHQMLEHQKVHSDDKPWVCDQCDYTAKSKWTFKKHYRKHTKEKPFQCQHCDYASSLSSNLTRHVRIHTGSKPFKCPYCHYSCNNHENLRKHVLNTRKHEGLYLYNCMHCSFATNVFSDLRQHMEGNHKDIYTVEEIDGMISSIYHKHEDNTTVVPITQSYGVQQINDSNDKTLNRKRRKRITNSKIDRSVEKIDEFILPENELSIETNNVELNDQKPAIVGKNITQTTSEIVMIDSDVLEAQEVCVTENSSHIYITISK